MSAAKNLVKNIAIVGAGGRVGSYITNALLTQGKHKITAITRPDSESKLPLGIHALARVDYNNHAALVQALKNQEVLIITLSITASPEIQKQLIDAAVEAGVRYIMPNEYGLDYDNQSLVDSSLIGKNAVDIRRYIEEKGKGKTHWIALTSSFWYEYCLAGSELRYGFDFEKKELTLFDEGNTKICTSTWKLSGEAVARVFALPIEGEEGLTLKGFEDKAVFVTSFVVSQREMLESVLRVTGEEESEWTVRYEDSKERYQRGLEMIKEGRIAGRVMAPFTRAFWPNGGGDFSAKVVNEQLGLEKEDLDEATKFSLQLLKDGDLLSQVLS